MKYPSYSLFLATVLCTLASVPVSAIMLTDIKNDTATHRVNCIITANSVAFPTSLNLPVFADKPAEAVSVAAFIQPDGTVFGTIGGKTQEKKALSDSVKFSRFTGAKIIGKPAWCSLKFTAEAYFYVDSTSARGDNYEAPIAKFRLEADNLETIKLLGPATKTDNKPVICFRFMVDEDGNTTSIKALDPRGEPIVIDMLQPKIASFVFQPASVNGKPVAATLILSVNGLWTEPDGASAVPNFMCEAAKQALPKLKIPFNGTAETTVRSFLLFNNAGMVQTIIIPGDISGGLAVTVMNKLRNWGNPVHFEWDCKMPIAVVEMKFTPGSEDATLVGEARPIAFTPPKIDQQGHFNEHNLVIDSFSTALFSYTIDANGKVLNIVKLKSSNGLFADKIQSMIEKSTYKPATIEAEPVDSQIEELSGLKIGEYWRNTDALKW
jgi:hypothetical protein